MKILMLFDHKDTAIRYAVIKGKGINRKMKIYDYVYFKTTQRVRIETFTLFNWDLETLKNFFSEFN